MTTEQTSRRNFLSSALVGMTAFLLPAKASARRCGTMQGMSGMMAGPHPTPRKGYTAEKVLAAAKIKEKDLVTLFDGIREIPQIVDGIRCHCGCVDWPGKYSLLSCYEGDDAMALWCPICEGQGRLVVRLNKAGKSLDEIREAVDARY